VRDPADDLTPIEQRFLNLWREEKRTIARGGFRHHLKVLRARDALIAAITTERLERESQKAGSTEAAHPAAQS